MAPKLYHISQTENCGLDKFDSAVVAAKDAVEAAKIFPSRDDNDNYIWSEELDRWVDLDEYQDDDSDDWYINGLWAKPSQVRVRLLGVATEGTKPGVICASYTAG